MDTKHKIVLNQDFWLMTKCFLLLFVTFAIFVFSGIISPETIPIKPLVIFILLGVATGVGSIFLWFYSIREGKKIVEEKQE